MITIFFVDRFVAYSTILYKEIEKIMISKKDYEIFFIGPKDGDIPFSTRKIPKAKKIWTYGKYFREFLGYIKKQKPNIVHFSFELITYGPVKTLPWFPVLLFFLQFTKIKIVLTLHNLFLYKEGNNWEFFDYPYFKIPNWILKMFDKFFMKTVCTLSDKIIVCTFIGKKALMEYYRIPEQKIEVSQLGSTSILETIDTQKQEKFRRLFSDKKIILYFGVISPRKNQRTVIKAFKKIADEIPDHILVIAGSATETFKNYEENLHYLSAELRLEDRVFFLGHIKNEEIDLLYDIADIALFLYQPMSSETFALTFAMNHSTPCIVSDIEIFHEVLNHKDALFVKPNDEGEVAKAMLELTTNEVLRTSFKEKMKEISKKFTWEKTAKEHLEIYKKLLNKQI